MMYWRNTSFVIKYLIVSGLCLFSLSLLRAGKVHAAPVVDRIPPGTMPAAVESYLLDCGHTNGASAQVGWLSLAGSPTQTVTTVSYGTPTVALQYNVAGIVCDASRLGGLTATNNGIISTSPVNLGLTGSTLTYFYGGVTGGYSVASRPFTYTQTGTFTSDTVVSVSLVEKRINVYSVNPRFRCVTNVGVTNSRSPNSGTDYAACSSQAQPIFSVRVNVVLPSPSVACTVADTTIILGQSYTPRTTVTHRGPSGAPGVAITGTLTVQGQAANNISGSVANGSSATFSGTARTFNAVGTYNVRADLTATSSRPTVTFNCQGRLVVRLPDPQISCSVNNPTILAGEATSVIVTIDHLGPVNAPAVNYNAVVSISTKPNQSFNGTINNGGAPAILTTNSLVYGTGIFNVSVSVTGNASTTCNGTISSLNRPYISTYNNDVLAGFGFYDTSTCPTSNGDISAFGRGAAQSFSGSGSQLAAMARGQISGFRSASTLASAAATPAILAFANTVLVNTASGSYGGTYGSGVCMYNYWASNGRATRLGVQSIDIGTLTSGSYYIRQNTAAPVVITGRIANGRSIALYIEGTAILRGAVVGYASTAWATKADIPSLYIIARGNIVVGSDVRNLDGHYIAQKSNSTDGRITSCVDPATGQPYASAAAHIANCSAKLTINGSFHADHVNLLRTFASTLNSVAGEPAASSNAAEVFIYPIESYLSIQNVDVIRQQTYDSITALPPSL